MAEDNNVIRVPEGLCTACSATQYCAEHQPVRQRRLYPRASPLSRALREIAKGKKLSSLQVPVLEDAASHIEDLEDRLRELSNVVDSRACRHSENCGMDQALVREVLATARKW